MKKRIAFVLDEMHIGGTEKALIELLNSIDYRIFDVTLFLKKTDGPFQKHINTNVSIRKWYDRDLQALFWEEIKKLKIGRVVKGLYFRVLTRMNSGNWVINTHYATRCIPPIRCEPFDCVIAYQYVSPSVVSMAYYNIPGKKKAIVVHGRANHAESLLPFLDRIYCGFDRVFCVSKSAEALYKKDYPRSGEKTVVMHNMIDAKSILEKSKMPCEEKCEKASPLMVTVGRLSYEKGQDLIPKTARILKDLGYSFSWYLIGEGPLRENVEQEIKENDVADEVILLGTKENPYTYINMCDYYIQTSRSEGWGLTVQEARILNKPIVATPVSVMAEQIRNGENGLIVDAMTPEALAEGIETLFKHPEMIQRFHDALKFESHDNSRELEKLYSFIKN